jgi:hypothetical protein
VRSPEDDLPSQVSVQVGAKGGTLKASGMTLEIPEGALDKNVKISAKNAGQTAPKEVQAKQVSDLYEFGPDGTKFNKEVKITFHTEKEEQRAEVYFTKEDGSGFEKIASQKNGKEITAFVKHFSQGFVGVPLDDAPDAGVEEPLDDGGEAPDAEEEDAGEVEMDATLDADTIADTSTPDPIQDTSVPVDATVADAAVDAGPAKTHIVVTSRDMFGVLVNQTWAAFQDGQGAWQTLPTSSKPGVYEFDVVSGSLGVAFVCSSPDQVNSWNTITYKPSTSTKFDVVTHGPPCTAGSAPPVFTLQGKINLGSDQYWRVGHSHLSTQINFSTVPPDFILGDMGQNEVNDVLFASGPSASPNAINRILVRRNVMIYANTTGYDLDIVKDGSAPLGTFQAQVLNATNATYVDVRYITRNTADGLWLNTTPTTGSSTRVASFAALPTGLRLTADRYLLAATDSSSSEWRNASFSTYTSGNLSATLPPAFVTAFASVNTPYLRPTFGFTPLTGANLYAFSVSYSPLRTSLHMFSIDVDPASLTGSGAQTLTFPDFSQVTGFQTAWVAPSSGSVSTKAAVQVSKSDASGDLKTESGQSATLGAAL